MTQNVVAALVISAALILSVERMNGQYQAVEVSVSNKEHGGVYVVNTRTGKAYLCLADKCSDPEN